MKDPNTGKHTLSSSNIRLYVENIDNFKKVKNVDPSLVSVYLTNGYLDLPEDTVQVAIEQIINEPFHKKDWGGEENDLYTSNVKIKRKRIAAAFFLKGRGIKKPLLEISDCGKNGDQIVRLFQSPAQLFIVQYNGTISENIIKDVESKVKLKRYSNEEAWYCIITGQDTVRLLYAYEKLPIQQRNNEVYALMRKFNDQKVPGEIFGAKGKFKLDRFNHVHKNAEVFPDDSLFPDSGLLRLDVYALGHDDSKVRWIVKTELCSPRVEVIDELYRDSQMLGAKPWLVVFDSISPDTLALAKKLKVMVTGIEGWRQLEELFGLSGN